VLRLFPEDSHSAVIGFTKAVRFLANMHTFEFVVVEQMIAAVFERVDSIEFNLAEWTHPGFIRTNSDQLLEVEQCFGHAKILSHRWHDRRSKGRMGATSTSGPCPKPESAQLVGRSANRLQCGYSPQL
jgi:hypothetical protein